MIIGSEFDNSRTLHEPDPLSGLLVVPFAEGVGGFFIFTNRTAGGERSSEEV